MRLLSRIQGGPVEKVSFETKWTRSEYIHARWREYRFRARDAAFFVAIALMGWGVNHLLWIMIGGVIFWVVVYYIGTPYRVWNHLVQATDNETVTFAGDGISVTGVTPAGHITWDSFSKSKEKSTYYTILRVDRRESVIIPKHFLKSSSDELMFRSILRAHTASDLLESSDTRLNDMSK
jgi:hypothetical protein